MKKIATIIFLASCVAVTSCKKFLDTKPTDFIVPEQYYNTEQQLNEALSGVYNSLTATSIYGLYQNFYHVATTDESYYKLSTTSPHPAYHNISPAESRTSGTWNDLYKGINRANYLLANINKPSMDERRRNAIRGEALFLRAYMYYLLVTQWGDVPLFLEPTVDGSKVNNPATPSKQIYDQILKDMVAAKDLVNDYSTNGTPVHVSKTAVQAMLARVCLKMAGEPLNDVSKFTDARAWADSVIQSRVHALNPDYKQVFINECADLFDNAYKEVLWEIDFYGNNIGALEAGGRWNIYMGVRNTDKEVGYSYGYGGATGHLYKLYSPGDLRRDWAISPFTFLGNAGTTKVLVPPTDAYSRIEGKWRREFETVLPKNTEFSPTNYPIIRFADVLLMYAEAENEINGPTQTAYDALNAVRRRAFGFSATTPVASVSVVKDITLSTSGNTGYAKTVPTIPVTLSGGGGSGATATASVSTSTGKVTAIGIVNPGLGYTSAPTVIVGTAWQPNMAYPAGTQVFNGNSLYTVTVSGTSSTTPPTQTSGASNPAVTGTTFTYAGAKANGTASIATATVDVNGLSKDAFRDAIRDERSRELCFEGIRKFDLIRWGIFVPRMKQIEADMSASLPSALRYAVRQYTNVEEKHKFFPIPTLELSLNSALKQNPLWE
jgi:starch-binding outer membrane protein, SusD/RagB family